ncbi:GNAT family N-acetyltransferase [Pluralibacter gergoviae]|uniref:GNAT family N-acetyltransferase n=1 Tax=Pluralibacter gergoviae TaxID=61647 RepID=UPI0028829E1D|nr:GNAT family N-acetyltransferase [Pluralibacter gergoviae]ELK5593768.1 GNAT family N-acetyltransferase [Pluralibacter gergoviae]MDU4432634.1 GNAT family N-acetyltransferase [Pluralibacter gergoviae]
MKNAIAVRPPRPADIAHLPAVERSAAQAFLAIPALAWLAQAPVIDAARHRQYRAQGRSLVAVQEGVPVGFVLLDAADDALFIAELSVRRDRQGQGAGRSLLNAAAARARHNGLAALTLTTFRHVPWNAPFYARLGFAVVEEEALTPELKQRLEEEAAHGLAREMRCAMRLTL